MAKPLSRQEIEVALLQSNYFPRIAKSADELPPCFTSKDLTPAIARRVAGSGNVRPKGYDSVAIFATRFDLVPRRFDLPHPHAYSSLAIFLADHWAQFEQVHQNKKSKLRPRRHRDGRLFSMKSSSKDRLSKTFGTRFVVKADVTAFYASLYTHALSWALVGRSHSKANTGPQLWFNKVDKLYRNAHRAETMGVAIGPGTSAIAGEVLLQQVDLELVNYDYERFIDDFILHTDDRATAEAFLLDLTKSLSKFNLAINPRKTTITELPVSSKPVWIRTLQTAVKAASPSKLSDALDLLDLAVDLTRDQPDASSLKWALVTIERSISFKDKKVARGLADVLANLSFHRPVATPYLVRLLLVHSKTLGRKFEDRINALIRHHAKYGRSDAVSWLLYLCVKINLPIADLTADAVVSGRDCLAIVLLQETNSSYAQTRSIDFANSLVASSSDLYDLDEYWLLLYQLQRAGKLTPAYPSTEGTFGILIAAGVNFLDFSRPAKKVARMYSRGGSNPYNNFG